VLLTVDLLAGLKVGVGIPNHPLQGWPVFQIMPFIANSKNHVKRNKEECKLFLLKNYAN